VTSIVQMLHPDMVMRGTAPKAHAGRVIPGSGGGRNNASHYNTHGRVSSPDSISRTLLEPDHCAEIQGDGPHPRFVQTAC
jgi:hypothetical protein